MINLLKIEIHDKKIILKDGLNKSDYAGWFSGSTGGYSHSSPNSNYDAILISGDILKNLQRAVTKELNAINKEILILSEKKRRIESIQNAYMDGIEVIK